MALIRTQVTIPSDNAIPADWVVNTFCFDNVTITDFVHLDEINDALRDFYDGIPSTGTALDGFMANDVSDTFIVKHYNLASPEPRAPLQTAELEMTNITVSGASHLPRETALCLSFQGVQVSGQPQARRRGRIYAGPFISNAATIQANGKPGTELRTTLQEAGNGLLVASNASAWFWSIYSQTDNAGVRVDNGWVDDAWDTQRRRGFPATTRATFVTV